MANSIINSIVGVGIAEGPNPEKRRPTGLPTDGYITEDRVGFQATSEATLNSTSETHTVRPPRGNRVQNYKLSLVCFLTASVVAYIS